MRVVDPQEHLVAEGQYEADTESVETKPTRKGKLKFLQCRITSPGRERGRVVECLVPGSVRYGSNFHQFLVAEFGALEPGEDIEPERLVGRKCIIDVVHVAKSGHVYANIVGITSAKKKAKTQAGKEV